MTEAQRKRFYFPAWNRAFAANWESERGRLGARAGRRASEWLTAVIAAANELARQQHGAATADHLRHACHLVALGKNKSSHDLTNAEIDRVVNLFALLEDPEDLDAVMKWQHPEIGERQRCVRWIESLAPYATIVAVARNNPFGADFDFGDWQSLEIPQLKWLGKTLRERGAHSPRRHGATERKPQPVAAGADDPDWNV